MRLVPSRWLGERLPPLCALVFLAAPAAAFAQSGPSPSFDPNDQPHTAEALDSVDRYTGQLALAVPIGPRYDVGPGLSFQLRLHYSSGVWGNGWPWAVYQVGQPPEPPLLLQGDGSSGLGWRLSLGQVVESAANVPLAYVAPDGSTHRFYPTRVHGGATDGWYHTRDDSAIRARWVGSPAAYELGFPDGTTHVLGKQVTGKDDPPSSYTHDFGRGRNGWYATSIRNAHGATISITYQAAPHDWILSTISFPRFDNTPGGSTRSRSVTVSSSNGRVASITVPMVEAAGVQNPETYSFSYDSGPTLERPLPHPSASVTSGSYSLLREIRLPAVDYVPTYTFQYFTTWSSSPGMTSAQSRWAVGALRRLTTPRGAQVDYQYGTYTFYHANPQARPGTCLAAPSYSGPVLRTSYLAEPALATLPIGDCNSPDRSSGVVRRQVTIAGSSGDVVMDWRYHQLSFPRGESQVATSSEALTLEVSPLDGSSPAKRRTTTWLCSSSTASGYSGPLVGAASRIATFEGDVIGNVSFPPAGSGSPVCPQQPFCAASAKRMEKYEYETDPFDTSATIPIEARRRIRQAETDYHGEGVPSPKYHRVAWADWDTLVGRWQRETHSGTIGGDGRETVTTWVPPTSALWKLDRRASVKVRSAAGGADFATTSHLYDAFGLPTQRDLLDGSGHASSVQGVSTLRTVWTRDANGVVTGETFSWAGSAASYRTKLTTASGTVRTEAWLDPATGADAFPWKSVSRDVDPATGAVLKEYDASSPLDSQLYTTFAYDALGRTTEIRPPKSDAITQLAYPDPLTTRRIVRDPAAGGPELAWDEVRLDELGRVSKVRRKMPRGPSATDVFAKRIYRYDLQGNLVFESEWVDDAATEATAPGTAVQQLDLFGRPARVVRADGSVLEHDYRDGSHDSVWKRRTTVHDVRTPAGERDLTTTYETDGLGRLTRVTDPESDVTTYQHDALDRLVQVTQESGQQVRAFSYDAFGFLRKVRTPEVSTSADVRNHYDPLGNVTKTRLVSGSEVDRTYDEAGRPLIVKVLSRDYERRCYDGDTCDGVSHLGGLRRYAKLTQRLGYDDVGSPPWVVREKLTYDDPSGRLSWKETSFTGFPSQLSHRVETFGYDKAGALVRHGYPGPEAASYDVVTGFDHGHPTALVADGRTLVSAATYHRSGLLASLTLGNGVVTTVSLDPSGVARPGRVQTSGASSNLDTGLYLYDGAANVEAIGADAFAYDQKLRLVSARIGGVSRTYGFDSYGNLTQAGGTAYSVNPASNRLNAADYDTDGNVRSLSSTGESWEFDHLGRIRTYTQGAGVFRYAFDGRGERAAKVTPASGTTYFFRDAANRLVYEENASAKISPVAYFHLGGLLVATRDASVKGEWRFYSSDHLGTPRLATDPNGTTRAEPRFWPFGEPIVDGPAYRPRFAGMERETEEGVVRSYVHARTYDSGAVGRWLSPDPVLGRPDDPQTWNRYAYARNNPLRYVDPNGKWTVPAPTLVNPTLATATILGMAAYYALVNWARAGAPVSMLQMPHVQLAPDVLRNPTRPWPFGPAGGTVFVPDVGGRSFGPDGRPQTDSDLPHEGAKPGAPGSVPHAHDWKPSPDGGAPTRGEHRPLKPGDPPLTPDPAQPDQPVPPAQPPQPAQPDPPAQPDSPQKPLSFFSPWW